MPIFKVTVEIVQTHTTYVFADDEATALDVPNGPDWYSADDVEPVTRATRAERITSVDAVPKDWRNAIPWGTQDEEKTIRQWLRKKA